MDQLKHKKSKPEPELKLEAERERESADLNSALEENKKVVFGELLRRILNGLNNTELLESARLVSKRWRDDATWILRRRMDYFGCRFKFHPGKNTFILFKPKGQNQNSGQNDGAPEEENEDEKDVVKLTEMLSSDRIPSHNFPTAHFHFEGGSLNCPQVLEFFSAHGKNIRKLTVDVRENPPKIDGVLRQKILPMTSNLESLEFMDSDRETEWPAELNDPGVKFFANVNQGQVQGQILFEKLKTLKFSRSISHVNRIQTVLKLIRPALPQSCSVSLSELGLTDIDLDLDLELDPDLFNRDLIQPIGHLSAVLFDSTDQVVHGQEQLAKCRLKFKAMASNLGTRFLNQVSPRDVATRVKTLFQILESSREVLQDIYLGVELLVSLSRQPIFPGFFQALKAITLSCDATDESDERLRVDLFFPRNDSNPNPVLWKNLSEIAPSLGRIILVTFDGDCERWLPFLDPDAGPNLTVNHLIVGNLYRKEILQPLSNSFPSLTNLDISIKVLPPPTAQNSVENLINWVFSTSTQDDTDSGPDPSPEATINPSAVAQENKPAPSILSTLKVLESMYLVMDSCGLAATCSNPDSSGDVQPSSSNLCSLSKLGGESWFSISADRCSWREISGSKAVSGSASAHNGLGISTAIHIRIRCYKHKETV